MANLYGNQLRKFIIRRARALGLDPKAVLAVVYSEGGLGGAVGDHGTSFGPFQLHMGGALPKYIERSGSAYAKRWANSPQGIMYALTQVAGVAAGQTGHQAIASIVGRFEHPANVQAEIDKAWGYYSGGAPPPSGGGGVHSEISTGLAYQKGAQAQSAQDYIAGYQETTPGGGPPAAEGSLPGIMGPGTVPAEGAGPKYIQSTWQALSLLPLSSDETRFYAQQGQGA